jgi:hypothetical protein
MGRDEERITVAGREYILTPPTIGALIAAERELRRHCLNPLRRAAEQAKYVPVEQAKEYWRQAYEAERDWHPTLESLQESVGTELQLGSAAIMLLHRHHAADAGSLEQAVEWLSQVDLNQFMAAMSALMPPSVSQGHPPQPPTGAS